MTTVVRRSWRHRPKGRVAATPPTGSSGALGQVRPLTFSPSENIRRAKDPCRQLGREALPGVKATRGVGRRTWAQRSSVLFESYRRRTSESSITRVPWISPAVEHPTILSQTDRKRRTDATASPGHRRV